MLRLIQGKIKKGWISWQIHLFAVFCLLTFYSAAERLQFLIKRLVWTGSSDSTAGRTMKRTVKIYLFTLQKHKITDKQENIHKSIKNNNNHAPSNKNISIFKT